MQDADPNHNLIFSSHAYWFGYANSAALVEQKLNEADAANVCFVLGEVANTQDGDSCGSISLATLYPTILAEACECNIGWLAWTFDQDCFAPRKMTSNGEFSTLTAWGNDLVYNAGYGLLSDSPCAALKTTEVGNPVMVLSPNPVTGTFGFANATFTYTSGGKIDKVTFPDGFYQFTYDGNKLSGLSTSEGKTFPLPISARIPM